jgi:hypothetical protein
MADDLEDLLRHSLRATAGRFHPDRGVQFIDSGWREGLQRRRRKRVVAVSTVMLAILAVGVLVSALSGGARLRVTTSDPVGVSSLGPSAARNPRPNTPGACLTTCGSTTGGSGTASVPVGGSPAKTPIQQTTTSQPGSTDAQQPGEGGPAAPAAVPPPSPETATTDGNATTSPSSTVTAVSPSATTTPVTATSPTTIATGPQTVVLTSDNSGQTIEIAQGDTVILRLGGCPGTRWSPPVSSDLAVMRPDGPPAPSTTQTAAQFLAAGPGQAQLTASIRASTCVTPTAMFAVMVLVSA